MEKLPRIAATQPFKVEIEAQKTYSWCSCGFSQVEPFCDGSHKAFKNEDGSSIMKSVKYTADETKIVSFCGCKQTKTAPFCDGSHSNL